MPSFSVIIPTRNRPQFLLEAVASVFTQTLRDFEIIVVNDGDGEPVLAKDSRVRLLDNGRRGAVAARNLGISEAKNQHVAFLDDDDFWIDDSHLAKAQHALVTGTDFYFADGIMRLPGEEQTRKFSRHADAHSLERDNTILISAVCYRRALHARLGTFDAALPFYWDWDWYLRVARAGCTLHHQADIAVDIRVHAQNMSGDQNVRERRENLDAFARKHGLGGLVLKNHADFAERA